MRTVEQVEMQATLIKSAREHLEKMGKLKCISSMAIYYTGHSPSSHQRNNYGVEPRELEIVKDALYREELKKLRDVLATLKAGGVDVEGWDPEPGVTT